MFSLSDHETDEKSCPFPRRAHLEAKVSKTGFGLFNLDRELTKGEFVCIYAGEIISTLEAEKRWQAQSEKGQGNYILTLKETYQDKIIKTQIDPTTIGNVGRFISQ